MTDFVDSLKDIKKELLKEQGANLSANLGENFYRFKVLGPFLSLNISVWDHSLPRYSLELYDYLLQNIKVLCQKSLFTKSACYGRWRKNAM